MNEPKEQKAVIYCRVVNGNDTSIGHALKAQADECQRFAIRNSYHVIGTFNDMCSGLITQRPGKNEMIGFLRENPGTTVLVASISRVGRSVGSFLEIRSRVKDARGNLICVDTKRPLVVSAPC